MDEIRLSVDAANELSSAASDAIKKAHKELEEPDADAKYTVDLRKAKGVIVGDNARQWNTFGNCRRACDGC